MVTDKDLPAARQYANAALTRLVVNSVPAIEAIEGAYLDGLAAGRGERAVGYLQGQIDEAEAIVKYIRRKVEEGRASLSQKQVGGFLRAVALEQFETFELLAEALQNGDHYAAA